MERDGLGFPGGHDRRRRSGTRVAAGSTTVRVKLCAGIGGAGATIFALGRNKRAGVSLIEDRLLRVNESVKIEQARLENFLRCCVPTIDRDGNMVLADLWTKQAVEIPARLPLKPCAESRPREGLFGKPLVTRRRDKLKPGEISSQAD
jgi:hypothetical protein